MTFAELPRRFALADGFLNTCARPSNVVPSYLRHAPTMLLMASVISSLFHPVCVRLLRPKAH